MKADREIQDRLTRIAQRCNNIRTNLQRAKEAAAHAEPIVSVRPMAPTSKPASPVIKSQR